MVSTLQPNELSGQFFENKFSLWSARHGDTLRNGPYVLNEAALARVAGGKLDRIVDGFRALMDHQQGTVGNWIIIQRYLDEFIEAQSQIVEQSWANLAKIARVRDDPMNFIMDKMVHSSDKLTDMINPPKGEALIRLEDEIKNCNKALQQAIKDYDNPQGPFQQAKKRLPQMNWDMAEKFLHADSVKSALLSLRTLTDEVLASLKKQQNQFQSPGG